ncbi:hypothetical protein LTR66_006912 [Elasticomyces elasticus]|nr:hypothetical protein LTR66_006912 [Elasticomyces elasticus]
MVGNGFAVIDGVGNLTIQRALDVARNTEGDLDPFVSEFLELAVQQIWSQVQAQPDSYILTKDEFAVFNYHVRRFEGSDIAQRAIARFWINHQEPEVR